MLSPNTMKKTIGKKTLKLQYEQIRLLDPNTLRNVAGGVAPPPSGGTNQCSGGCQTQVK
jgi:hypothetical protein